MASMANKYLFKHVLLVSSILVTSLMLKIEAANEDYNRYLMQIFQKYGNGSTMQYKDLVNLMNNLELRQDDFHQSLSNDINNGKNSKVQVTTVSTVELTNDDNNKDIEEHAKILDKQLQNGISTNLMQKVLNEGTNFKTNSMNVTLEYTGIPDFSNRAPHDNNICLTSLSLIHLVRETVKDKNSSLKDKQDDINQIHLTPETFVKLCPVIITQLDQRHCRYSTTTATKTTASFQYSTVNDEKNHGNYINNNNQNDMDKYRNAWIYAAVSISILSSCGLLSILLVPLMKFNAYEEILNFLVAVAVGTLSGDALMHLLPHALIRHEHLHENSHDDYDENSSPPSAVWICACTFFTTVLMYMIENVIPIIKGKNIDENYHQHHHQHQHNQHHHHTQHSRYQMKMPLQIDKLDDANQTDVTILENNANGNNANGNCSSNAIDPATIINVNGTQSVCLSSSSSSPPSLTTVLPIKEMRELNVMLNETALDLKKSTSKSLSPLAFMVIIGDGLHNLTDGLAIGAAFATDPVTGLATAFAVLCHELPHELGDFALLLQTGVSIQRAICLNLISSVLSVIGMIAGLLIAGLHYHMTQWVYAATAGSFLYISFADLVPAMAQKPRNLKTIIIQVSGILIGGIIMISIAVNEQHLAHLFE